jgi:molecular chaperone GrpE
VTDERLKNDQLEEQTDQQEEGGELALLRSERDEAIDRWKRTAADFENYKRRAAREREEYVVLANERLIAELLPVLDDLERALDAATEHRNRSDVGKADASADGRLRQAYADEAQLEEGVRLVHRSLAALLERHGVRPIDTNGQFDPHVHEALLSQPSEADEGAVIDVIQKGYRLGDRVVRPARVVVAAAPPAREPHEGDA